MNLPSFVYSSSKTKSFFFPPNLAMLCGLQDLRSPKKIEPRAPAMQEPSPNHWTAGNSKRLSHFLQVTHLTEYSRMLQTASH